MSSVALLLLFALSGVEPVGSEVAPAGPAPAGPLLHGPETDSLGASALFPNTGIAHPGTLDVQIFFNSVSGESRSTTVGLHYGLTPSSEVFVEAVPWARDDATGDVGAGDVRLAATWLPVDAEEAPVSITVGVDLATARVEGGLDEGGGFAGIVASTTRGPAVLAASYEVGVLGDAGGSGVFVEHRGELALGARPWPGTSIFSGLEGVWAPELDERESTLVLGAGYALTERWLLEAEARIGIGEDASADGLSLVLAYAR